METRVIAWHWNGSLTGFLRSVAVGAACAIALGALLLAAISPTGDIGLTRDATAAQSVAEPQGGRSEATTTAESTPAVLAGAALWSSSGLRLEAGDGQNAAE